MVIDIIALMLLVLALFKGWTKGLVMAVFTLVAYVLALFVAFKFSGWVAVNYFQELNQNGKWASILSFIVVMIAVMLAVRILGKLLEKTLEIMLLGFWNKVAGVLLFGAVYFSIYSTFLVYAERFNIIKADYILSSTTGSYLMDWGRGVVDAFGDWIPELKSLFNKTAGYIKQ